MTEQDFTAQSRDYDPEDDPFACGICGCSLPESKRILGEEYCDGCQRTYGVML